MFSWTIYHALLTINSLKKTYRKNTVDNLYLL